MNSTIPLEEMHFFKTKHLDDLGKVFEWDERIFRAIYPGKKPFVHSLFSTGLLDELSTQKYIPKTWITDLCVIGFSSILEHERIWPVVYPQEWTFSMLKDAALFIYSVSLISKRHGFNMKDAHGFNVLFDGTTPKYSDIGSFIYDSYTGWFPYEEFLKFYYYPLMIWQYNSLLGKLSIFKGRISTHETYLNYWYPFFRRLNPSIQKRIISWCIRPPILAQKQLSDSNRPSQIRLLTPRYVFRRLMRKLIPIENFELDAIIKKIQKINKTYSKTSWGYYHEKINENTKRFARITEILNNLNGSIDTAVDLGGNQGRFSKQLLRETRVKRVACIDADENAIEEGYHREKTIGTDGITFAYFDFMERIVILNAALPDERFKADVVFALALTHHLILAQCYDLNEIFTRISSYARKYVFIEFMPLGLWSKGQDVRIPDWYSLGWFRNSFIQFFDLVHEEKLRKNRVLFVGIVRPTPKNVAVIK